jgi:hypothetical protein
MMTRLDLQLAAMGLMYPDPSFGVNRVHHSYYAKHQFRFEKDFYKDKQLHTAKTL